MQAKLDAADLAVRTAEYEKSLLAHQLNTASQERMRLQVVFLSPACRASNHYACNCYLEQLLPV
jgi:hypothetical protein